MSTRSAWSGAAATAAAFVLAAVVLNAVPASAVEPDVLPDALWWRGQRNAALDTHPLQVLRSPQAVALDVEWAPLYAGDDGARVERERHTLRFVKQHQGWRGGVALDMQGSWARGGGRWWLDAERPITTSGALAVYRRSRRFEGAASLSLMDRSAGVAAGLRAQLAPRVHARVSMSRVPRVGRAFLHIDDIGVVAAGRWIERRQSWDVAYESASGVALGIGQQTLDRARDENDSAAGDRLEPAISWRASSVHAAMPAGRFRVSGDAHYGAGREVVRVYRSGLAYAAGQGPVTNLLVGVGAEHERAPYRGKLWFGRWRGNAEAVVALWPFNGLAAAVGTRQIAHSNGVLRHYGVSVDRALHEGSGIEGGLALWRVEPQASFQSWRSTLLGIGRSGATSGASDVSSVVVLGLRLAGVMRWNIARVRAEAVQWLPLRVERERAAVSTTGEPDVGATPGASAASGERGGTVVRVSIEVGG